MNLLLVILLIVILFGGGGGWYGYRSGAIGGQGIGIIGAIVLIVLLFYVLGYRV